jgi:hypothetical protein
MTERFKDSSRFDGAETWAKLSAEEQAAIGAAVLEHTVALHGLSVIHVMLMHTYKTDDLLAAEDAASPDLVAELHFWQNAEADLEEICDDRIGSALSALFPTLFDEVWDTDQPTPIPSLIPDHPADYLPDQGTRNG